MEIGFPGEIIHKDLSVAVTDMSKLPSAVAATKLRQMLEIKNDLRSKGATSRMARLTHARLFGSDDPYRDRTSDSLLEDIREIEQDYGIEDEHFRFGEHGSELQLVIYNQGEEPVRDVSLTLVMPQHPAFHIANRPPPRLVDGRLSEQHAGDDYPSVREGAHSIKVSSTLGDIDAGGCVDVFRTPLKICVGRELAGQALRHSVRDARAEPARAGQGQTEAAVPLARCDRGHASPRRTRASGVRPFLHARRRVALELLDEAGRRLV